MTSIDRGDGTRSGGRLAGRTAVVTGASRGIGRAIAVAFAAEGAAVAVAARSETVWDSRLPGTVHETAAAINEAGGRAIAIPADLSDPAAPDRIVAVTRQQLGPVTLLVNNAAVTIPGGGRPPREGEPRPASERRAAAPTGQRISFVDLPLKSYRLHFDVGVFAAFRLMQLVLSDMTAAGRGAIVNISSLAASTPGEGPYSHPGTPTQCAYGGNKAALEHLTRSVAFEVAPLGVSVNALSPSVPVASPGLEVAAAGWESQSPAEEFAEATVRLALADAQTMTGTVAWHLDILHPELGRRGWIGDATAAQ